MDYAWSSLGRLKIVLIVLLVLETLFVQLACMLMLATLVKVRVARIAVPAVWRAHRVPDTHAAFLSLPAQQECQTACTAGQPRASQHAQLFSSHTPRVVLGRPPTRST